MEIITINRKQYPVTVLKMKVKDLDKIKLSNKFLSHNFNDEKEVYIKCDINGNIEYRGKNLEYRTYNIDDYGN